LCLDICCSGHALCSPPVEPYTFKHRHVVFHFNRNHYLLLYWYIHSVPCDTLSYPFTHPATTTQVLDAYHVLYSVPAPVLIQVLCICTCAYSCTPYLHLCSFMHSGSAPVLTHVLRICTCAYSCTLALHLCCYSGTHLVMRKLYSAGVTPTPGGARAPAAAACIRRPWLAGLRPPASTMSMYRVYRLRLTPEVRSAHHFWAAKPGRPAYVCVGGWGGGGRGEGGVNNMVGGLRVCKGVRGGGQHGCRGGYR
jgi:hypothetical protein